MKILGIIPARYASSRLIGKPLIDINGLSMIQRVYRQVNQSQRITKVIVATDDQRVFDHVRSFNGDVKMTATTHQSGTDRCAEVAAAYQGEFDAVINIQGDEPFIQPEQIDALADFMATTDFEIGTLARLIAEEEALFNSNVVKVIFAAQKAIYFSRHPIPFIRQAEKSDWMRQFDFYQHIGMYAFRMNTLLRLPALPPSALEKAESLEQLRWLENGFSIGIQPSTLATIGIDTPEDLAKAKAYLAQ